MSYDTTTQENNMPREELRLDDVTKIGIKKVEHVVFQKSPPWYWRMIGRKYWKGWIVHTIVVLNDRVLPFTSDPAPEPPNPDAVAAACAKNLNYVIKCAQRHDDDARAEREAGASSLHGLVDGIPDQKKQMPNLFHNCDDSNLDKAETRGGLLNSFATHD